MASSVSGHTRVCGIIGDPIEHTMSPAMHNAAFAALGLDYVYVPFPVKKPDLYAAVQGLKAVGVRGFNVTIPHKVAVMPMLDTIDGPAKSIGAVNTVVISEGEARGYNTDASGFLQALRENGVEPRGQNVVVLGAGGAARAMAFALAECGARLTILNRNAEAAVSLADHLTVAFHKPVAAVELNEESLAKAVAGADVLVNATSMGMTPHTDETPVPAGLLRPRLAVFDAVYNPLKTRLLQEAEAAGCRTVSGLDMLVGQGAVAFELWTGRKPPVDIMREAALKALAVRS